MCAMGPKETPANDLSPSATLRMELGTVRLAWGTWCFLLCLQLLLARGTSKQQSNNCRRVFSGNEFAMRARFDSDSG